MITLNSIYDDHVTSATGTSEQEFAAVIKQRLCKKVCSQQSLQPTYNVTYSLEDITTVGTTTFATLKAVGNITYVPKGACNCNTITQAFTEQTVIIFANSAATKAPALTLSQGASDGTLADLHCTTASSYQIATEVYVKAVYS